MNTSLLFLILIATCDGTKGSRCMSTDCTNTGSYQYKGLSLYLRVCCVISNLGQSVTIRAPGINTYIFCPKVRPKHCPTEVDCHSWFQGGYNRSGVYTIFPDGGTPTEVYCDMEGINCDGEGGWTRVGHLNMTQSGATCPTGLSPVTLNNHTLCGKPGEQPACVSTLFSASNMTYSKVCGQVRGYQVNMVAAFTYLSSGIEGPYVNGISITYGRDPRQHIWTYAGGLTEFQTNYYGCPCNMNYTGDISTSFVGFDYYCESASGVYPLYITDPLWDGQQCNYNEATCCPADSRMPWFYRSLDHNITDDIEFRGCGAGFFEAQTAVDIIELYIK